jgi:hypothetical protein
MICVAMNAVTGRARASLDQIKRDYQAAVSQVKKHTVNDFWIDGTAESTAALKREWRLAGEWVATWLNEHPSSRGDGVSTAITQLMPSDTQPRYLKLNDGVFLVSEPGFIGSNVFILAKASGRYRLAWSTAQFQNASGKQAEVLSAWQAENARDGGRNPSYATSLGRFGPIAFSELGRLPDDASGHARFYIQGGYAQSAGNTVGQQISLWSWNGVTAHLLRARDYISTLDDSVGVRLEGNLLKVREKKPFRTFWLCCAGSEERATDWTVRLNGRGLEDLGEKSVVPELDAIDHLFFRLTHHQSVRGIASSAAAKAATEILRKACEGQPSAEWTRLPSLGVVNESTLENTHDGKLVHLSFEDLGNYTFRLESVQGRFFVGAMAHEPPPN